MSTKYNKSKQNSLPPYPEGWFVYAFSDELARGRLLTRPFMGQAVAVFRTQSGQACAVDAYCPHLGAHFGYGGTVEGEYLRCPFHGFRYDTAGTCVRTGYDTKPPPKAKLKIWPLCETNGMLLIYHADDGSTPKWQIPVLDRQGWTRTLFRQFTLFDHPQETTENSVDLGHFAFVHKYRNARMLREVHTDGPYLTTAYAVQRTIPGLGIWLPNRVFDFQFETQIYGLGYSMVNVTIPALNLHARLWVLPTPLDGERITLYLALSLKVTESHKINPLLALVPRNALNNLLARVILSGFVHDTKQDVPIWEHKRYTDPPALAEGDGPIGRYRHWARQFYAQNEHESG